MKGKLIAPLLLLSALYAAEEKPKKEEPPKCGNFSLPVSQQPGPLVSFGENIINKGDLQLFLLADGFYGKTSYLNDIYPGILWGIRDNLSLFLNFPFFARQQRTPLPLCWPGGLLCSIRMGFLQRFKRHLQYPGNTSGKHDLSNRVGH